MLFISTGDLNYSKKERNEDRFEWFLYVVLVFEWFLHVVLVSRVDIVSKNKRRLRNEVADKRCSDPGVSR